MLKKIYKYKLLLHQQDKKHICVTGVSCKYETQFISMLIAKISVAIKFLLGD